MKACDVLAAARLLEQRNEIAGTIADLLSRDYQMTLALFDDDGNEISVISDDGVLNGCRDLLVEEYTKQRAALDEKLAQMGVTDLDEPRAIAMANQSYYGQGGTIDQALEGEDG